MKHETELKRILEVVQAEHIELLSMEGIKSYDDKTRAPYMLEDCAIVVPPFDGSEGVEAVIIWVNDAGGDDNQTMTIHWRAAYATPREMPYEGFEERVDEMLEY